MLDDDNECGENDESTALPLIPVATPFLVNAVDPTPRTPPSPGGHESWGGRRGIRRGDAASVVVVLSIIAFFSIIKHETIPKLTPSSSSKAVLLQNDFIADFTHALVPSVIEPHLNTERPPDGGFLVFTPFILQDGTLLCHREFEIRFDRQATFIDMIRATLSSCGDDIHCNSKWTTWPRLLPLMLLHTDQNGCSVVERSDMFAYPRLSWSQPATKYGDDWCNTISVSEPSNWNKFQNMDQSSWDAKLASNLENYPWSSKINKAVWRGSTTYHPSLWGVELNDTPRGKLVQTSMTHPELIDAAFVNLAQYYKGKEGELRNRTIVAQKIPFDEQMTYRAIIDIDGNNWSSRFAGLLCTNSVVIKIDPDYIESFYSELRPMEHYVPASLENITQVTEYVLRKENEEVMKDVVNAANLWCKVSMTGEGLRRDMMLRLGVYATGLDNYMKSNSIDVSSMATLLPSDDFVECVTK